MASSGPTPEKPEAKFINRRFQLQELILELLQNEPSGISKDDLWNHVQTRLPKKIFSAKFYGLQRMHDFLIEIGDKINLVSVKNKCYIQLKPKYFRKRHDVLKDRQKYLERSLLNFLSEYSNGVQEERLWTLLEKTQFPLSPNFFGLDRLHDFLERFTGVIEKVVDQDNICHIRLVRKTEEEQRKTSKDIPSNKTNETVSSAVASGSKSKIKPERNVDKSILSVRDLTIEDNSNNSACSAPINFFYEPDLQLKSASCDNLMNIPTSIMDPTRFPRPLNPMRMPNQFHHQGQQRPVWGPNTNQFGHESRNVPHSQGGRSDGRGTLPYNPSDFPSLSRNQQPSEIRSSSVPRQQSLQPNLMELKYQIILLLSDHPAGIVTNSFWNMYRSRYRQSVQPSDYGVKRLKDIFDLMSDVLVCNSDKIQLRAMIKPSVSHAGHTAQSGKQSYSDLRDAGPKNKTTAENFLSFWGGGATSQSSSQPEQNEIRPLIPPNPFFSAGDEPVTPLVTKKLPERKPINVAPVTVPRGTRLTSQQIESIAKDCIDILSEAQEFVSPERIETLLLQRLAIRSLRELNLREVKYVDNIKCVNEHNRMIAKINAYTQAFVKVRSLCTLSELSDSIKEFVPDDGEFIDLKLGPLQKLPTVYDLFKFPIDEEIPEISSLDILQHLREYMTKFNKWTDRLETEDVMKYLVAQYGVPNAYSLGIRLRSLPLCAQVLKKAQRDDARSRKMAYDSFIEETKKEVAAAFIKFRAAFLKPDHHNESEIRDHYLKLQPEIAISEIFRKFLLLMSINQPVTKAERKRHTKLQSAIQEFLQTVKTDDLARMLLHLSVCVSNLDLQEAAMELMAPPQQDDNDTKTDGQPQHKDPPNREKLLELLKKYVDRCLTHGALNLNHLDRIEEKLCEEFGFGHFSAMGFGRYLSFLLTDVTAKTVLEESGGTILGSSSSGGGENELSCRPQQSDVMECIKQCKNCGNQLQEEMENTVCEQYRVKEFRHLGLGNISRMLNQIEKHGKRHSNDFSVTYEAAICGQNCISTVSKSQVGVLGHQTKESALACLHNCPFLTDLAEWSHWSMVFEPEHGKLKDFIQKYGGIKTTTVEGTKKIKTDIMALEITPGKLVKIVADTSTDKFSLALKDRNALKAVGHLVSIIVELKGVKGTPLALLSNHMKTNLFSMHSEPSASQSEEEEPSVHRPKDSAVQFVLDCLVKLPLRICATVANQMFIDPLGQVVGSTKSKQLLWINCRSFEQYKRLEELGFLLGIDEWMKDFQTQCKIPDEAVEVIRPKTVEDEEFFIQDELEEVDDDDDDESSEIESQSDIIEISSDESESEEESEDEEKEEEETDDEDEKTEDVTKQKVSVAVKQEPQEDQNIDVASVEEDDTDSDVIEVTSSYTEEKEMEINITDDDDEDEDDIVVNKCLDIINQLRKDEFGVGIELNEDGERLMKVNRERQGRMLDRLSKDLYSKDTHFVLELLQNADDNTYPDEFFEDPASTVPTVKFVVGKPGVTVLNNECGFKKENIKALCDVGRSTKGKHKYGYIGQKGIGFKSVFRITDRPEVHSNDYHICFDVNSGPTGYILPHWLEDVDEIDEMWTTRIFLPLKESLSNQIRSLAARFNDIHPSLLLFLHRIKHIMIENQIENTELSMVRKDQGSGIIEICHNNGTDRWLVVKKMLDASNVSQQTKSGVDVESTEIALAFPMRLSGEKSVSQVLPSKQPVFAFLPLRSYGLRFIVQGDFDVPSSREDVDRDSPWNQWLRNELPNLFIEALEAFKTHADFRGLEAVSAYLQFVPMEDEVLDFFRPFAAQILQKLKAKACIPTQPNSRGAIYWKIPSQTVAVRDILIREVVTPELLQKHLDLYYIHTDVAAMLNPSLTQTLGIETLTTSHLLQVGGTLAQTWEMDKTTDKRTLILTAAKWMACIYRSLDEFKDNNDVYAALQQLKIIPLSSGYFTSLSEETVFLPLSQPSADTRSSHVKRDPLAELHKDLNTIHLGLVNTPDNEVNSQVQKLLLKIGVRQLQPSDVINHHIMPVLKSDAWKNKSRDVLVCYMIYIKEQLDRQPGIVSMEEIIKYAQVITNHKVQNPAALSVHFTPAYGNKLNLSEHFPGYDWVLLDSCYIIGCSQHELLSWRNFFIKLGVTDFLSVKQTKKGYTVEQIEETPWKSLRGTWPHSSTGYVINDYYSDEFHQLVTSNKKPGSYERQMKLMFEILDRDWDSIYSKYSTAVVNDKDGSHLKDEFSSFDIFLKTLAWVPALQFQMQPQSSTGTATPVQETFNLEPSSLYARSPRLEIVLGHMVKYLAVEPMQRSSFCNFLGIKTAVDVDVIQDLLVEYTQHKGSICFSLQHIKEIYKYLIDNLPPKKSQDLFHNHAVIFLPDKFVRDNVRLPNTVLTGRMVSRNDVWWEDSTGLFNKHRCLLEEYHSDVSHKRVIGGIYGDMRDLLQQAARLQQHPSLSEYCELLNVMSAMLLLKDKQVISDVLHIYSVIGEEVVRSEAMANNLDSQTQLAIYKMEEKELVSKLKTLKVFITKKGSWVGLKDKPMISDNKEMEKLFFDQKDVHLLELEDKPQATERRRMKRKEMPHQKLEAIMAFLQLSNIPKLTEQIELQEVTQLMEPCPTVQLFFHKLVPLIQRYLVTYYEEVYAKHIQDEIAKHLKSAVFMQTDKLEVKYTLKNNIDAYVIRPEKCIITAAKQFYFHKKYVDSVMDINKEVSRIFCGGDEECKKDLRTFLSELSPLLLQDKTTEEDINRTLENHEVDELPEDEDLWEIMAPNIYIPPPLPDFPMEEDEFVQASDQESSASKDGGLRAWPPKSATEGMSVKSQSSGDKPKGTSTVWPPPEQPDYMKTLKDLPPQIKIIHEKTGDGKTQTDSKTSTDVLGEKKEQSDKQFTRTYSSESGDSSEKKEGVQSENRPATSKTFSNTSTPSDSSKYPASDVSDHPKKTDDERDESNSRRPGTRNDNTTEFHEPHHSSNTEAPALSTLGEHIESEMKRKDEQNNMERSGSVENLDDDQGERDYTSADRRGSFSGSAGGKRRLDSEGEYGPVAKRKHALQFGLPSWSDTALDYSYIELGRGRNLKIPESISLEKGAQTEQIGRWGELVVYHYLLQLKEASDEMVDVIWVNKREETGDPFDFQIVYSVDNQDVLEYVEVKSTISSTKEVFEISSHQIRFAMDKRDSFHVYRLFGAGDPDNVRLVRIENLCQRLDSSDVKLCLVI